MIKRAFLLGLNKYPPKEKPFLAEWELAVPAPAQ